MTDEFIKTYTDKIQRKGSDKLLEFLQKSDFFIAPASTKYHGSFPGGLLQHSLNVYQCLLDYLSRPRVSETYKLDIAPETIAISALLHDVCKIGCYRQDSRNVKNEQGQWEQVPCYRYEDSLPYGHGEKSVYMISGFMTLTREEAFAIRYHMGFSGEDDKRNVGKSFELYPLAFALSVADMEATFFIENKKEDENVNQ